MLSLSYNVKKGPHDINYGFLTFLWYTCSTYVFIVCCLIQ